MLESDKEGVGVKKAGMTRNLKEGQTGSINNNGVCSAYLLL